MKARWLPNATYLAIKGATRHLVQKVGGLAACSEATRLGEPHIARAYHPDESERFLPIDVVADLEHFAGLTDVTSALASITGHTLVKLELAQPASIDVAILGNIARESGQLVGRLAEALADHKVTPAEAVQLRAQVREALKHLTCLDAELKKIEAGPRA